uniref:Uncharacterized protein n=1 Tax=Rhizophora mucronata TaxID=61149 RepID=A0A2P2NWH3_RHIMU
MSSTCKSNIMTKMKHDHEGTPDQWQAFRNYSSMIDLVLAT